MRNANVLVIRFSSLGDVVLTTPVYRSLKEAWPDCRITVLVKSEYAGILEGNPHIDRILTLSRERGLWACVRECRTQKFDVLLDLHANLRSWVVRFFGGARKKIVYKKDAWARRMLVWKKKVSPVLERHTIERYLDALRELGIAPRRSLPEVYPDSAARPATGKAKLLVVQTAFLGDAVLTTPLLASLSQEWPEAQISVLTTPQTKEIFTGHPALKEVLLYDKKGEDRGWKAWWRLVHRIRSLRFDVAVLPHRSFRSALLVWLARIPRRIGFSSSAGRWFLTDRVPFSWSTHDVDRNLLLLRALNLEGRSKIFSVGNASQRPALAKELLEREGVLPGSPLVGFVPGSVWATKRWLPERFAALGDMIQKEGARVLLIGGPSDRDSAEAVEKGMSRKPVNFVGKTNLQEATALLARCSVVVTNDSGPMHLAAAVGTPVVAIFGSTTRELGFFPYGDQHRVIEKDLPCRPCGLHGHDRCPLGHFRCMTEISAEEVFRAVREKLGKHENIAHRG